MPVYRQTYSFRDARGFVTRELYYISAATFAAATTAATTLQTALNNLTNAAPAGASGPLTSVPSAVIYGGPGQFQNSSDKAGMTFATSTGAYHRYRVPAPLASIFLADLETVDPTNAAVTSYVNAVDGNVSSRDGVLMASFIGGLRVRGPFPRRINILIKNPAETGPDE